MLVVIGLLGSCLMYLLVCILYALSLVAFPFVAFIYLFTLMIFNLIAFGLLFLCEMISDRFYVCNNVYIHNLPLQRFRQDYWPSFSHHLCCV